uniref:Uncharacterized protein n=1 Tax=Musa acuminata subsp. malaccensis TaxID=214687 RepID=A0A804KGL4_MUSAM
MNSVFFGILLKVFLAYLQS